MGNEKGEREIGRKSEGVNAIECKLCKLFLITSHVHPRYDEELVIPIIENQNEELDIKVCKLD